MRFYGDQARGLAMLMFAVAIGARGLKFLYCPCFLFLLLSWASTKTPL